MISRGVLRVAVGKRTHTTGAVSFVAHPSPTNPPTPLGQATRRASKIQKFAGDDKEIDELHDRFSNQVRLCDVFL